MNKAILLGRLAKDPEVRFTSSSGTLVANFSLAVNRRFAKPDDDVKADFLPVVAWDKLGKWCQDYLTKGKQVAVVGRIQVRSWDDADGKKHYITEIIAEDVYFADSKGGASGEGSRNSGSSTGSGFGSNDKGDGFYPIGDDDELPF